MKNQRAKDTQRRLTAPLTAPQRSFLGLLADGARRMLIERGAIDERDETAKAWRHREAREATKDLDPQRIGWTISEAPKQAFDALKARFEMLSGASGKALETLSGPSNDVRQLSHQIAVLAREIGVNDAYIGGIANRMFGRRDWRGAEEGRAILIALKQAQRTRAAKALAAAGCV